MAIHPGAQVDSRPASPLERLVRERGLRRFGLFFVTGEGEFFPNRDEEQSGYVIDDLGQTYSFWTGWDDERDEATFTEWEVVDEEPEWRHVGEYQRARARAGLPPYARPVPTFEESLDQGGWLTVSEMADRLEAKGYWLLHPTVLSRRAKQRHVAEMLQRLRGPHGIPLFIRALRKKTHEHEYVHPISATPEDIRREGRHLLSESLKRRPAEQRSAQDDQPVMTIDAEGCLIICARRVADSESVERAHHLLAHLGSPDPETREEDEIQGLLSTRLSRLIENGTLQFMEGVALQEQQSIRVHLRRSDGLRLVAQLMAAVEHLGERVRANDDVLGPAYEAGLFAGGSSQAG